MVNVEDLWRECCGFEARATRHSPCSKVTANTSNLKGPATRGLFSFGIMTTQATRTTPKTCYPILLTSTARQLKVAEFDKFPKNKPSYNLELRLI
ncbi:hypothetical protein TNCV_3405711 [Trichonephila clavipes]|nr:hypothetical protein TNCV_3405711 [Trichonephila clavipes]